MGRTIYLLRHCQPEVPSGERSCLGHTDVPLAKAGWAQAAQLAEKFGGRSIRAVYSSDLKRSYQTAQVLADALTLPLSERTDLREIDMGAWDGLTFAEIRRRWPEAYRRRGEMIWQYAPPGGESFACCARRAEQALAAILAESQGDVLIVAHSGLNRALLWQWGVRPPAGLLAIEQAYGCVNRLSVEQEHGWLVQSTGECWI